LKIIGAPSSVGEISGSDETALRKALEGFSWPLEYHAQARAEASSELPDALVIVAIAVATLFGAELALRVVLIEFLAAPVERALREGSALALDARQ
jgi:hypothetical protein